MKLSDIQSAVKRAAAFRCRTKLQPAGGEGDKVFPSTYAGGVYAIEKRKMAGRDEPVWCVCIDSVQSQANRMEDAMQDAVDRERLKMPLISVEFPDDEELVEQLEPLSSLQVPHRVADAILRDSELDGTAFRKSDVGKALDRVSNRNATPLFELCPTALIYGMWDSTGPKGGLGAKFERAVVSEIIGYDAQFGVKTSSRIDPLQIRAAAQVVKKKDDYQVVEGKAPKGAVSPSEVNHGNIPPDISGGLNEERGTAVSGGVTLSHAEQTVVISLPQIRRLRFPMNGEPAKVVTDDTARTVLAALALTGAALAAEKGFDLRSRCLLWPTEPMQWEILDRPGSDPETFQLDSDQAISLLDEAVAEAEKAGLTWNTEPLVLTASEKLMKLIRKSQEVAAAESVGEGN